MKTTVDLETYTDPVPQENEAACREAAEQYLVEVITIRE